MASGVNFGADDYTVKVGLMAAPQGVEGDSAPPPPPPVKVYGPIPAGKLRTNLRFLQDLVGSRIIDLGPKTG
jgi:hypothetical protein